jgi:cell division protein FtsB
MTPLSHLTRAHPQSEDGEMRHRAAADIARLTAENEALRIENAALERFCALLSENYDRLLLSTRRK